MTSPKVDVGKKATVALRKVNNGMQSRPVHVALTLVTALLFVAVLVFNYLAANPQMSGGLFKYSQGEVSEMYPVLITPAGWAFAIWGVIYLLMGSWVLYNLALLCRTTPEGEPAYTDPSILSSGFMLYFNFSCAFNISWLFIWDRFLFTSGLAFLACIALSLYLAWAIVGYRFALYKNVLIDQGRKIDAHFINVAVVNGIAAYATWSTIATLINLNVVLVYKSSQAVSFEMASIIALTVLAIVVVVYVALDLSVLDRYTRYTVAPYLVVVWASAAIISKNWDPQATSSIMAAVILGATALATLSKIVLAYARGIRENYEYRQMGRGK